MNNADQGHARVEVGQEEVPKMLQPTVQESVRSRLLTMGFATVTVDPAGYRQGSANGRGTGIRGYVGGVVENFDS